LGKGALIAAPVVEGANAAGDAMNPFLKQLNEGSNLATGLQLASRAGLRIGGGGLGAAAGTAAGLATGPGAVVASPTLGLAGGIAGYEAGDALSDKINPQIGLARNLQENEAFITQKRAEIAARQQAAADAAAPAPAEQAPVAAPVAPDSGESSMKAIMDQANAQAVAATAKPEMTTEQANEAARAQMATMDAAALQQQRLQGLGNDRMRNEGQLAQTKYDAEQAANETKRFKYDPGSRRGAVAAAGQYANAQAQNQAGIDRQQAAVEGAAGRDQQNRLAGVARDARMEETRMGLRGDQYKANLGLASHMADHRLQALQLQNSIGEKNTAGLEKTINERLQVFTKDKEGKSIPDSGATQALQESFRRFAVNPSTDQVSILQAIHPGAKTLRDIPPEKWNTVMDQFNGYQTLLRNVGTVSGEKPEGIPTKITSRENKLLDAFSSVDGKEKSGVGLTATAMSKINPFASPEDRITLTMHTPGARTITVSAADAA
jgi:hypothetical protein